MLVIASALAVPDPRERPLDKQQAADQAHLRFRDERSDFLSLLALWQFFADALAAKLSHRELVDRCRAHFVSYLRLREWRDLHRAAVRAESRELGWQWTGRAAGRDRRSALRGDPPGAARRAAVEYRHARPTTAISTSARAASASSCTRARASRRRRAKWVLAAELTETTRLYARCAAKIEPEWIEAVAGDSASSADYFDPRWDKRARRSGRRRARRAVRTDAGGAPARVATARVDPAAARDVFLREALAADELADATRRFSPTTAS